ncbi:MAG: hypothetical protein KF730_06690 [Sphingomonas sp.]|uniref:hypothetical protein n=1 Tax=Sphingomonas sp. TaxID=28214 RepID=UPI0025F9D488|nr:hypothetical protein [Sphingomonas sp.]MBX3564251.1 hypothetical protein [Sphingomonas sp.]
MRFFLAGTVPALLMSGAALAHEADGHKAEFAVYQVSMQLHDGSQLVASPTLDVKVGEMATVSFQDEKGQRYSVRLMPMRIASGKVFVASSIDIAAGSGAYLASPVQMAQLGEAAAIELDKDSPASRPFRLDFTLTAAVASAP